MYNDIYKPNRRIDMFPSFTEFEYALEEAQWLFEQTHELQTIYFNPDTKDYYVNPPNIAGLRVMERVGV